MSTTHPRKNSADDSINNDVLQARIHLAEVMARLTALDTLFAATPRSDTGLPAVKAWVYQADRLFTVGSGGMTRDTSDWMSRASVFDVVASVLVEHVRGEAGLPHPPAWTSPEESAQPVKLPRA